MSDAIANALGIDLHSSVEVYDEKHKGLMTIDQSDPNKTDSEVDYEKVRSSTYDLLDTALNAVNELAVIASQSQDSDTYSSLASLIKAAAGLNSDLMKLHHLKRGKETEDNKPTTVQNNLILSTADLQKMILEKTNG